MAKKSINLIGLLSPIIILIYIILSLTEPAIYETIEGVVFDAGMRFASIEEQGNHEIIIIEIDDKSLKRYGEWPWPRHIIADMVNLLNEHGVKLIGLNIFFNDNQQNQGLLGVKAFREKFTTYSYDRVKAEVTEWVIENLRLLEEGLDGDQKLVESVRNGGNVILPVMTRIEDEPNKITREEDLLLAENLLTQRHISASSKNMGPHGQLSLPFFELTQHALGLGYKTSSYLGHPAGRAHPMYVVYKSALLPSFPFRLAIAYLDQSPKEVIIDQNRIELKGHSIPITRGDMLIKSRMHSDRFPRFPFADILADKKIPQDLKGKIVIIGSKLRESLGSPPVDSSKPSENESVARILDSTIHRNFIHRPTVMVYIEILATLIMGGLGAIFFPRLGYLQRLGLAAGLTLLTITSGFFLLSGMDIWFKTVYVSGCLITIYVATSLSLLFTSERISGKSIETSRLLGLSFQSQGLLDLAFEKFRKLPLDTETKNLIYNLGLAYEKKRLISKALSAYEYIKKKGSFKDLDQRIPKLMESEKSSTIGSHGDAGGPRLLEEFASEGRSMVGRYEVLEVLGKGSMGLVYKAIDPRINRTLAIKTIRFSDEFDEEIIQDIKERFFREAEMAGKLAHPSIVTIFDVGEDGDLTYMAMEHLEGRDLEKFISKDRLLPFRKVLDVVAMIAEALDYAHKADVIHRDIKPANIMLLDHGGVKVTDFGIAKAISSSRTKTGVILGTPNYMSPEQIMGQKIDPKSDIFSLGVLFFQLLTGELPFHGDNLSSLLYQITQVKHPPLRTYNPKIPKICEQILEKALAKNSIHRFGSAGDMAKVLRLLSVKIDQLIQRSSGK